MRGKGKKESGEGGREKLSAEFLFPLRKRTEHCVILEHSALSVSVPARTRHVAQKRRWMGHHEAAALTFKVNQNPEGNPWTA